MYLKRANLQGILIKIFYLNEKKNRKQVYGILQNYENIYAIPTFAKLKYI